MLFPVRGGPSSSPCEPQAASCTTSRGASRLIMTKCNGIKNPAPLGNETAKLNKRKTRERQHDIRLEDTSSRHFWLINYGERAKPPIVVWFDGMITVYYYRFCVLD